MAAQYQTKTDSGGSLVGGSTTVTVGKPSGAVENDVLVAIFAVAGSNPVSGAPAGWNALTAGSGSGAPTISAWYKKLGAGEPASYDFTRAGTNVNMHWCVLRFNGNDITTPIPTSNGGAVGNDSTPSIASSITPSVANSLILQAWASAQDSGGHSNYAIATDNPATWNEILDFTSSSIGFAVAWADRAQTSATGNVSMESSDSDNTNDCSNMILAISPAVSLPANMSKLGEVAKASISKVGEVSLSTISKVGEIT